MATQLFLREASASTHLGHDNLKLDLTTSGWLSQLLSTARGDGVNTQTMNTVAGTTNGVEVAAGAGPIEWISEPVSADVTISGAVTGNIWASESAMNANVAINFVVDVIRALPVAGENSLIRIVKSLRTTEVALTTRAVNNFTATPGAAIDVYRGDRIRVRIFGGDAGTMGSGFSFTVSWDASSAGVDGDTYITFTETFAFESAPTGTQLFLTDTASDVATAAVDREAWTSRGIIVADDVTNTAAGWTDPIQMTDTAGGTVVDWFSKQLQAFTLGGMAQANLRALESVAGTNASLRCELARVDSDGTNPSVWGTWCIAPSSLGTGEIGTTESAFTAWVSGDDLAFSNGQRIRIRVHVDDESLAALVTGRTVTFFYNGAVADLTGDSYVILPQSVSEFVGGAPTEDPYPYVGGGYYPTEG